MYCSYLFVQAQWESEVGKQSLFSLSLTTTQGVDKVGWTFIHDVKDNKKRRDWGFQHKGMLWETGCVQGIPQVSHMGVHDEWSR